MTPSKDWTLNDWTEFARRDDCLERMVPSDLRQLIGFAVEQAVKAELAGAEKLNNALMNMEQGDAVDFIVERKYKSILREV